MAKSNSYPNDILISDDDKLFGSDAENLQKTRNYSVGDLKRYFAANIAVGASAYDRAVYYGFVGTEAQWIESLQGQDGEDGKSAYELAVENGFTGTEEEWLNSLAAENKTAGALTLSATPQVLQYDINSVTFTGGIAYLPTTTKIGKEIIVITNANNITIRANVANTNKMFETFNTFVAGIVLSINSIYRFTYIGFGTGAGGVNDGFWKAENMNVIIPSSSLPYKESAFRLTQSSTSDPSNANSFIDEVSISPSDNSNPLYREFTFQRSGIGMYNIRILWLTGSASAINSTKIDISCSDAKVRLASTSNGSFGPYSYYQQDFQVYDTSGALADNILNTTFYARLFN